MRKPNLVAVIPMQSGPRSKQFGYLFTKTSLQLGDKAIYRTIAHELAHGSFHLNHTFDNQYQIVNGSTQNLMDYTGGTDLVKHQWDAIHDPGLVIGTFERDEEGMSMSVKKKWDDIIKGSLSELGIRPGYYICVNENTGETTITKESYIVLEKEGNKHLKLVDIIKIYEFKCPGTQKSEEYFKKLLLSDNTSKIRQGICPYYPHSMKEFRVQCETWLTDEKTIFINGELEGIRGIDFKEECLQCETNYPSYYFMNPEELINYAKIQDPLVIAFYEVLKNHANRIMNNDIRYSELTESDIVQFFIDIVPDILDFFFIDKPTPYGGFGPSTFIKDKLPDIDDKKTFYINTENIQDAIDYFNKIKDEYYLDPKLIKY